MIARTVIFCACLQVSSLMDLVASSNFPGYDDDDGSVDFARIKIEDKRRNENFEMENSRRWADPRETDAEDQSDFSNPWYKDIPLLPIVFATSPMFKNGPCKMQSQRYLRELRNGTLWATQMYDSSTKYPDGLISGHTRHFGDFDGCYNLRTKLPRYDEVNSINDVTDEITGRYCLVDIHYEKQDLSPVKSDERHDLEFDPNDSVWEAIREKGDFRRVKRYKVQMALCVPEVCTSSDVEMALQEPLKKFGTEKKLDINVSVKPHFCQALKDSPKFSRAARIYCWILAGIIILVIVSTSYDFTLKDYNEDVTSIRKDLLLCFSARRNFNSLMETTSGHRALETLHLMRYFYLTLTMVGHRTVQYYAAPVVNMAYMEWLYKFKVSMQVLGGPQIVEGFFSMGGLLVSYSLLAELDAKKKMNFLGPIIIRFLRLTPSYMVIVFFNALVLPYLGSGPYWEWKVGLERDSCTNNWWTNFLYINNYVNTDMMCMFQTWYLSVDYHLYILALMAIYLFWRMPRKTGYFFLSLIIFAGCVAPFMYTYVYNVQPLYKGLLYMQEVREDPYFIGHYVKTHERITSYFIGVLFGAVIYDHSRAPWYIGKFSSNILFLLFAVVFSLGSQILGHKFFDPNANPTILEAALYACLHKGAFAISACAIPALITFGTGLDFHYNFMTPRWVQPLARLTYGAYLIHSVNQLYDVASTRSARSFGIRNMFWDYIPDVAFTFGLSLLLALIVEGPFRRIEKRFIMKRERRNPTNNNVEKEAKKAN